MQAHRVRFSQKGKVVIETTNVGPPDNPPGPGQVLVEAICSVISPGTELAFLHARPNTTGKFPASSGYCMCGRIIGKGAGTKSLDEKQVVAVGSSHASAQVVAANDCCPIPTGMPPARAAAFMVVAIALQAVRKGQIQLGDSVAVLGLGLIGNLAAQWARTAGAASVVGVDPVAWRRDLAIECGLDEARASSQDLLEHLPDHPVRGQGFDVVIEATGLPDPINDAFHLARQLGRVVLLGSTRGDTGSVNFYRDVHKKGLTVVGAHNSIRPGHDDVGHLHTLRSDQLTSLDLIAAGRIQIDPLISDTVPALEAPKAYERLTAQDEPLMTIALNW